MYAEVYRCLLNGKFVYLLKLGGLTLYAAYPLF